MFNSEVGVDGIKHVSIKVHFRSVDIVTVPDEEEIIAAMEEIRKYLAQTKSASRTTCTFFIGEAGKCPKVFAGSRGAFGTALA